MMHVLVVAGKSAHSHIALQQCLQIAQSIEIKVTALVVVKQETDIPSAELTLAEAKKLLETAVIHIDTKIRTGRRTAEIAAEANLGGYDLLILGERSSNSLKKRLVFPSAQRILTKTECPVLIVKTAAHPLARLLICDSGAQSPNLLDRFAANLPQLLTNTSTVTVLHVMSQIKAAPGVHGEQLRASADELMAIDSPEGEMLTHDMETLLQAEVEAKPKIRHGLVIDEIMAEVEDGRYDLVIIGAHQREGWQHILLEDITRQVVSQADRPVLVYP
jgi:nucleotide-binding universal stress UspA family protein